MPKVMAALPNTAFDVRPSIFVKRRLHDTTGCQAGWTTGSTTGWMFVYTMQPVLQLVVNPVEQQVVCLHDVNGWMLGCMNQIGWIHTTGWTTGWMFVYTIQPVVQPVTTGCETGLTTGY